jgi:hypothetical protein
VFDQQYTHLPCEYEIVADGMSGGRIAGRRNLRPAQERIAAFSRAEV